MTIEREKIYWLAWSKIGGIGCSTINKIYQYFGDLETAWSHPSIEYLKVDGIGKKTALKIDSQKQKIDPHQFIVEHQQQNPHFCYPQEDTYPQLLLEIPNYPALLYYKGDLSLTKTQGANHLIGIVGTRKPTDHGKRWTYKISQALAKKGFTIVSGLADGIDGIAHRACLDIGGKTIAVLGNGLDRAYPYKNKQLMAEIAKKGVILTEYECGTVPNKNNFPARNRIVAGLCRAVLVMEAPEKSGALITARLANEFNRDVYTLPDNPDNLQARGCLRLIHKGAEIIITEDELLESLGAIPALGDKARDGIAEQQLSLFNVRSNTNRSKNSSYTAGSSSSSNSNSNSISNSNSNSNSSSKNPYVASISNVQESGDNSPVNQTFNVNLSPPLDQVYQAIASEPTSLDTIVSQSGLNPSEVSAILLQLELQDLITQLPGMMYQK